MACTKTTLTDRITEDTGLEPQAAHKALETFLEIMKDTLESGDLTIRVGTLVVPYARVSGIPTPLPSRGKLPSERPIFNIGRSKAVM